MQFGVAEGQGNRNENQRLPLPGAGRWKKASGNVRYQYGTLYMTGPSIRATANRKGAFAQMITQSLEDVRTGFSLESYAQSWGGEDAVIASVDGAVNNSTELSFKNPWDLDYDDDQSQTEKFPLFRIGMQLIFQRAAGDANMPTVPIHTIEGIKPDGTLVLDENITINDGAKIIRGDTDDRNNAGKNYLGLVEMLKTTGTYLNIPRTNLPNWQGNVIDGQNRDLSEDLLQQMEDTVEIHGDGMARSNLLISNHRVRRIYIALLAAQKRFMSPTELEGGFTALEFNGTPWVVDKLSPPERVYFLHMPDICWFNMAPIGWLNMDDGRTFHRVQDYDAYQATLYAYRQLACKKPANQVEIKGVTS